MEEGTCSTQEIRALTRASKPDFWALLLFKIVRHLKPQSCIELGTCVGISASYQATALKLNGYGSIKTLEGSPEIAKIAGETLSDMEAENAEIVTGPIHKTFLQVLNSCQPIDCLFNDGHHDHDHDHDAVLQYIEEANPFLSSEAVIIVDDITWSTGMKKAWNKIEDDKLVYASLDLGSIGIALVNKKVEEKLKLRITL